MILCEENTTDSSEVVFAFPERDSDEEETRSFVSEKEEEDEDDEDDDEMEVYEKLDAGCEERGDEGGKERRGDGDATAQNTTKSTIQTLGRKRKTNTNGKRNSDS